MGNVKENKIYSSINEYLVQEIKSYSLCIEQASTNTSGSSSYTKIDNFFPIGTALHFKCGNFTQKRQRIWTYCTLAQIVKIVKDIMT